MFRQSIRALSTRRLFSVTPRVNNLVSDLYVTSIKDFKPTAISADQEGIKHFKMPAKPSSPAEELSADAVKSYESADVETEAAPSTEAKPAAEEDWFVFPEEEEHH